MLYIHIWHNRTLIISLSCNWNLCVVTWSKYWISCNDRSASKVDNARSFMLSSSSGNSFNFKVRIFYIFFTSLNSFSFLSASNSLPCTPNHLPYKYSGDPYPGPPISTPTHSIYLHPTTRPTTWSCTSPPGCSSRTEKVARCIDCIVYIFRLLLEAHDRIIQVQQFRVHRIDLLERLIIHQSGLLLKQQLLNMIRLHMAIYCVPTESIFVHNHPVYGRCIWYHHHFFGSWVWNQGGSIAASRHPTEDTHDSSSLYLYIKLYILWCWLDDLFLFPSDSSQILSYSKRNSHSSLILWLAIGSMYSHARFWTTWLTDLLL